MLGRDAVSRDPRPNSMDRHFAAQSGLGQRPGRFYDVTMRSHSHMMHYALSESKCLLHHASGYRRRMQTANDRLKQVRAPRYETAVEAAQAMGIPPATYIQHENGTRGSGSLPRAAAERYAKFFRVSLDWLLTGKGEAPTPSFEPTPEDIERMLRSVIADEMLVGARIADLPHIFAPALHEQLARFRFDREAQQNSGETISPDKGVQSPAATTQADSAE